MFSGPPRYSYFIKHFTKIKGNKKLKIDYNYIRYFKKCPNKFIYCCMLLAPHTDTLAATVRFQGAQFEGF